MAIRPTDDIEFATNGAALIADPGGVKKKLGFLVDEAPPAHWFDWLFRAYWRWIAYLNQQVVDYAQKVNVNVWRQRYTNPGITYTKVAYGNNIWIALTSATGTAFASIDRGKTWVQMNAYAAGVASQIVYGNGAFVALVTGGGGSAYRSTDGVNWTTVTPSGFASFTGVKYVNGNFVIVGYSGASGCLSYSTTGTGFTAAAAVTGFSTFAANDVAYGNGAYVVVGAGGKISSYAASANAAPIAGSFTARTGNISTNNATHVLYSAPQTLFFVGTSVAGANGAATSPDGTTWTARTVHATNYTLPGGFVDDVSGWFVMRGNGNNQTFHGATAFTSVSVPTTSATAVAGLTSGLGIAVAVGTLDSICVGENATAFVSPIIPGWTPVGTVRPVGAGNLADVAYGDGTFVAVGAGGTIISTEPVV